MASPTLRIARPAGFHSRQQMAYRSHGTGKARQWLSDHVVRWYSSRVRRPSRSSTHCGPQGGALSSEARSPVPSGRSPLPSMLRGNNRRSRVGRNVACYGTGYRREVKACGAKWPVIFLVGMTGLSGGLWTQNSPASKSGPVLAARARNPTPPQTSGWQKYLPNSDRVWIGGDITSHGSLSQPGTRSGG